MTAQLAKKTDVVTRRPRDNRNYRDDPIGETC